MADRFDKLEAELASLRPTGMSARLAESIANQFNEEQRWNLADRCLAGAMSLGALAACVIVGILTWNTLLPQSAAPTMPPLAQASSPTLGQYQQALARGPDAAAELFR
jgi:hypothetical protein